MRLEVQSDIFASLPGGSGGKPIPANGIARDIARQRFPKAPGTPKSVVGQGPLSGPLLEDGSQAAINLRQRNSQGDFIGVFQ